MRNDQGRAQVRYQRPYQGANLEYIENVDDKVRIAGTWSCLREESANSDTDGTKNKYCSVVSIRMIECHISTEHTGGQDQKEYRHNESLAIIFFA